MIAVPEGARTNGARDYDVVVVGAGQGGIPFATAAAEDGRRVALVERRYVAGTCINEGCTPTKTMVASAAAAHAARRAGDYGVRAGAVSVDMAAVRRRTQRVVRDWRVRSEERLRGTERLDLIFGEARFVGPRRLEVELREGGRLGLQAPVVVLDTGARPAVPDLPGLEGVPFLDTRSILELEEVPRRLLILGGGYVAVEYAQMMKRLGSEVAIVQRGPRLLTREDEDVATAVGEILREDGVELILQATARAVSVSRGPSAGSTDEISLQIESPGGSRRLTGSHLLLATGRRPNTDALDLGAGGVEADEGSHIRVDGRLETTVAGVYAIGDVKGGPAFTHVSFDDFRILKANLLEGGSATTEGRLVPYTIFIDPQLGRVGSTEADARENGLDVQVVTLPVESIARAVETGKTRGFLKAVVDRQSGLVVGAAMLGAEGGELAALVQVAMMAELPAARLRDAVFAHPTLAESLNSLFSGLDHPASPR